MRLHLVDQLDKHMNAVLVLSEVRNPRRLDFLDDSILLGLGAQSLDQALQDVRTTWVSSNLIKMINAINHTQALLLVELRQQALNKVVAILVDH